MKCPYCGRDASTWENDRGEVWHKCLNCGYFKDEKQNKKVKNIPAKN